MMLLLTLLVLLSAKGSSRSIDRDCVMVVTEREQHNNSTKLCSNYYNSIFNLKPLRLIFTPNVVRRLLVDIANHVPSRPVYRHNFNTRNVLKSCDKIIGIVGNVDVKRARILHTLASRSNRNITIVSAVAPFTSKPVTNLALPNVLDMNPLSHYIEATVSFIDHWNWTRIGIIYDPYHPFVARLLLKQLKTVNKTVTPIFTLNKPRNRFLVLRRFQEYGTHITVLIMRTGYVCSLLKWALKLNLTWPQYAWIVLSNNPKALNCNTALEGVFLLTTRREKSFSEPVNNHRKITRRYKTFCDSIIAAALSHYHFRTFSNLTYHGLTGPVKFRDGKRLQNISIVQVINHSLEEISCYYSELEQLNTSLDLSASPNFPRGATTKIVELSISKTGVIGISLLFAVSVLLLTISLILYLYFRNEPEIKATSVSVSMCMYLSCYLNLLFLPFLLLEQQPANNIGHKFADFVCNVLFWFGNTGLPVLLIVTSLLIKLARVYAIFTDPFSFKKKPCSDAFLFLCILLMLLPQIIMLTLLTTIHPFKNIVYEFTEKSHIRIMDSCTSEYGWNWNIPTAAYVIFVTISLIILTLKSAKIRYKRFKDTKATNAFAFLNIFIIISLGFINRDGLIFHKMLYSIHLILPIACQLLLFAPKIFPPLKRRFIANREVKSKHK